MSQILIKEMESLLAPGLGNVLYEIDEDEKLFRISLDGTVILEGTEKGFTADYMNVKKQWENEFTLFSQYWSGREITPAEAASLAEEEMDAQMIYDGCPNYLQCVDAAETFLENTFDESIESSNYLLIAFALLDKRLEDYHLYQYEEDLEEWPQWLLDVYSLRVESMFQFG